LDCHRYAGTDPAILDQVLPIHTDHPIPPRNQARDDRQPPSFALLDDRSGLFSRIWNTISRTRG
jgi:hypothetical protein